MPTTEDIARILNLMSAGFYTAGEEGVITYANEPFAALFGLSTPEDSIGRHFSEFVSLDLRDEISDRFDKALSVDSHSDDFEFYVPRKNGADILVRLTIFPLVENGRLIGSAGMVSDMTHGRGAGRPLSAGEKKFRAIVENMSDVVYVLDASGQLLFVSPSIESLLGYEQTEVLGRSISEFVFEKDLPPALRNIRNAISEEEPIINEYRVLHKNGSLLWVQTNSRPLFEGDRLLGLQGSMRDITARKKAEELMRESEEKFRSLVETTSDWIWEVDAEGTYTYTSPQVKGLLGYEPDEVLGRKPFDYMPGDEAARIRKEFFAFAKYHEGFAGIENVNIRKDGSRVVLETSGVPRLDADGRLLGYRGIDRDITDRKRAEELLRTSRDELERRVKKRTAELERRAEQLTRLSSELVVAEHRERSRIAKVLHDHLQQLLVGARINQEILINEIADSSKSTAERVLDLINMSIREMRFLNAELAPPVLNSGDLSSSLEWLSRWMHENQSFDVTVQTETPVVLERKDLAVLLFQSIRELLLNVLKHSGVKSASVKLEYQQGALRAIVSDQGVGFDSRGTFDQESSNEKFGLFSIRERLLYLGGRLEIESAPNRGTTCSLLIPLDMKSPIELAPESSSRENAGEKPSEPVDAGQKSPDKIRVMLVDDHPVMREGLARMLNMYTDIEVVAEASDGKEAVDMVPGILPDVILMDVNMPEMGGMEATQVIHSEFPQVRIIGLSMYDEDGRAEAMIDAGASAYLSKGGDTDHLLAAIRSDRKRPPES